MLPPATRVGPNSKDECRELEKVKLHDNDLRGSISSCRMAGIY